MIKKNNLIFCMKGVVGGVLKASDRFFDEESEVTEVPAPRRKEPRTIHRPKVIFPRRPVILARKTSEISQVQSLTKSKCDGYHRHYFHI